MSMHESELQDATTPRCKRHPTLLRLATWSLGTVLYLVAPPDPQGTAMRTPPPPNPPRPPGGPPPRGPTPPPRGPTPTRGPTPPKAGPPRSEEHTSELQSQSNLVCRLLLEKKKHTDF